MADAPTNGQAIPRQPDGRWLAGTVPNPTGRPPGIRPRFAEKFLRDAFESWQEHGAAALETLRRDSNGDYCKLMAGLLPKNLVVDATAAPGPYDNMSADELERVLGLVRVARESGISADDLQRFLSLSAAKTIDGKAE
jgi:hypothetical protein